MMIKDFYILVGICFLSSSIFLIGACSFSHSSAQSTNQNSEIPALVKVESTPPNLNGRVYNSKTIVLSNELLRNLNCGSSNGYELVKVENHHEDEGISSFDLNIVVGKEVAVKIELPTGLEVKNFMLVSAKKTKDGFRMNTEWGGSVHFYETQFSFRCKESNFYLYKVKKDSFSTTSNIEYLDKKETAETKPNLPIEKFVVSDYL